MLPAGLKAAAAAALRALAESGKSTVFFEDSDDDEGPAGMETHSKTTADHLSLLSHSCTRASIRSRMRTEYPVGVDVTHSFVPSACAGDDAVDDSTEDSGAQQSATAAAASSPKVSGSPKGAGDNPLAAFLGSYRWVHWPAYIAALLLVHISLKQ